VVRNHTAAAIPLLDPLGSRSGGASASLIRLAFSSALIAHKAAAKQPENTSAKRVRNEFRYLIGYSFPKLSTPDLIGRSPARKTNLARRKPRQGPLRRSFASSEPFGQISAKGCTLALKRRYPISASLRVYA
jgi:hypothetical protein